MFNLYIWTRTIPLPPKRSNHFNQRSLPQF